MGSTGLGSREAKAATENGKDERCWEKGRLEHDLESASIPASQFPVPVSLNEHGDTLLFPTLLSTSSGTQEDLRSDTSILYCQHLIHDSCVVLSSNRNSPCFNLTRSTSS